MGEAKPILMPKLGQTVEESTILKWHKSEGDAISKGDVLFEIETDKAVLESEAFSEGTLLKIIVQEGETVPVQSTVGFIGEEGDAIPEVKQPPKPSGKDEKKEKQAPRKSKQAAAERPAPSPTPEPQGKEVPREPETFRPDRKFISPRARKLCQEKMISCDPIPGSGPNGRVIERNVQQYLEDRDYDSIRISPAAAKIAKKEEVDILEIEGSGDGGKIVVEDCERAVKEKPRPMSKMRQIISDRLSQSFRETPHFFVTVSVDMTGVLEERKRRKAADEETVYSVTDHVMLAVVRSLKEFDEVNSMTPDGKNVKWNSRVHLGLAVDIEQGLVVPAIRNADQMDVQQLHDSAKDLVQKAREGRLTPEEMTGSTFTISNMGMLGIDEFTAIINPGEGAILAVASTQPTPVVREGDVVVRDVMKMTLSADHRIIDGATGASFLNAIKERLES